MSSGTKRERINNSLKKFMKYEDVIFQFTYNYKNFDRISNKIKEKIETVPLLLVNLVNKNNYKGPLQYIVFASADNDFCSDLSPDYIGYYFKKSDALIEVLDTENTLVGYALINFIEDEKDIKINILCASKNHKNVGTLLIDIINNIGVAIKYKRIILGSTTEALPFYLKKEFYCEKEECPMYRYITKRSSGGMRKTRKRKST
jgi:hypothetical protein